MKGKKAKTLTGRKLLEKLLNNPKQSGNKKEFDKSSPVYQMLLRVARRYPNANFVFPNKKLKAEPNKKMALFDICDGMTIYCRYRDDMTFFVYRLPRYL